MSAQILEVPLLGVGTVLRLDRGARSMVKWLRASKNEYPPPPSQLYYGSNSMLTAAARIYCGRQFLLIGSLGHKFDNSCS